MRTIIPAQAGSIVTSLALASTTMNMTRAIDRISFRRAAEADVPFLLELRRQTMTGHQLASGVRLTEEEQLGRVRDRLECAQIILLSGEPVGLLKVARDGAEWHLVQIQLAPGQQRTGLGGWLVQTVIDDAKRAGASVRLRVLRANPALRLYERLGFRIVKEEPHAYQMEHGDTGTAA